MVGYYTMKDGSKISIFLYDEMLRDENWREDVFVQPVRVNAEGRIVLKDKEQKLKLFKNDTGLYIMWNGQKVYIKDFDADNVHDMSVRLAKAVEANDRWAVSDDEIIATLMKYSEDVIIEADMMKREIVSPYFGISLGCPDNRASVACVLSEEMYKKSNWGYKIGLRPNDLMDQVRYGSDNYYTIDFCDMLKRGLFKLYSKADYLIKLMCEERNQDTNAGRHRITVIKRIQKVIG